MVYERGRTVAADSHGLAEHQLNKLEQLLQERQRAAADSVAESEKAAGAFGPDGRRAAACFSDTLEKKQAAAFHSLGDPAPRRRWAPARAAGREHPGAERGAGAPRWERVQNVKVYFS